MVGVGRRGAVVSWGWPNMINDDDCMAKSVWPLISLGHILQMLLNQLIYVNSTCLNFD